ncbi:S8 family serine peptidase [Bradyrhizobium sp. Pear77]|uniref:S8 family serine peptidase n=1 Tax=Bradyrhizobium altum TaxID=1571202 RepID=UPI0035D637AE|nr:S8 family serine peptidase [Bradyrhizobium altum]
MQQLWSYGQGISSVRVAVLDGPVDHQHPCFRGARLRQLDFGGSRLQRSYATASHGTAVASLIFSKPASDIGGICHGCTGLTADIFSFDRTEGPPQCSETLLAYAINRMLQYGADVINISAGFKTRVCIGSPLLISALRRCQRRGAVVVAPVGNDGSEVQAIPACLPGVLAVGSLDKSDGLSTFTNYTADYSESALLAPGEGLVCAAPLGASGVRTGTSYAAAIVSGVLANLLSVARTSNKEVLAAHIGDLLLETATGCPSDTFGAPFCSFVGRLNIPRALQRLTEGR